MSERDKRIDLFADYADVLLAAGERLAEKLADVDDSHWTRQILDEWREAKDYLREMA